MNDQIADATSHYEAHGYAHLRAIAPLEVATTFLNVIRNDMVARPDVLKRLMSKPAVSNKAAYEVYSYTYPPLLGFHWGLTSRMCLVTGKRLAPTYAFFRVYQRGDICIVHSDRPACEHSLSMPLAYSDGTVWDFEIGQRYYDFEAASKLVVSNDFGDEESSRVRLNPGDAILYKGVNYRHGRTTPNPNRWSAHIFLHWIDTEGPHKEWAFDKRQLPSAGDFPFPA